MPIPESQLETWSKQGATVTSGQIYNSVRTALEAQNSAIRNLLSRGDAEIYLQGSYGNGTNIYGDSDVDIVVQLHSTWNRDLSLLPPDQERLYTSTYPNATYLWQNFYNDVVMTLRKYYGSGAINLSRKVPKVTSASWNLTADIVIATDYRKYLYFYSDANHSCIIGIRFCIPNEGNREVINYPKEHRDNGVQKNKETNERFKPLVRVFKNARNHLIDNGVISDDLVPSYFLECLIYNIPPSNFGISFQQSFYHALSYLANSDFGSYRCQNEQSELFGNAPEQWRRQNAVDFLSGLINLWATW